MGVSTSPRTHGRAMVPVLAGLTAIGPATSDIYLPAFPEMARDLAASASEIQLTLTASFVGLGVGQLLVGPLSDRYGRKLPLVIGMTLFCLSSLLCAVAPSAEVLLVFRVIQGLAGSAGVVISRAVVRDLYSGVAFTRFFARLMLVFGVAPIVAPLVGTGLLRLGDWRIIFVGLAVFGALLLLSVLFFFRETLPAERRIRGGLAVTGRTMGALVRQRDFMAYTVGSALAFAAMFSYIGGFSFVAQEVHGTSSTTFAILFGVNAAGFIGGSQLAARLAERMPQRRIVLFAAGLQAVGGVLLAAIVLLDPPGGAGLGLAGVEVALFLVVAALGLIAPSATALALAEQHAVAGTAAAVMGTIQLVVGGLAAPLVGLGGSDTAVPLGIVIAVVTVGGLLVLSRSSNVEVATTPEDEVVVPPA
ncbi:multidrug effflux MFS transporter [Blastococcus sp. CT_GayMR16]|uniref:multidrug effflux MFS transporter n=1 Tax=Blastococcus sp. CT_GayMR16 TaxID=2559607 RepID=UPI001073B672|nr:multidrug effflux MFS transporter [Blastococcus sp. CT_GayMR16]TFV89935.1 Bcr/CflA family efflux MFS transporter [Blastococcus sp. CT_GayMR16]